MGFAHQVVTLGFLARRVRLAGCWALGCGLVSLKRPMIDGAFMAFSALLIPGQLANAAMVGLLTQTPAKDVRVALVIGNGHYPSAPLDNPENDARAMAESLKRAGFEVMLKLNSTQREMHEAVRHFGDRLVPQAVGLLFYAGHGVQVGGKNYLIPTDADIRREDEVPFQSVDVQQVLDKMESAKNRLNIVILDACRNNPFARVSRSTRAGLSQMEAPVGALIAFATAPGSVASDGAGKNGLYTQHLLANIEQPGLRIEEVFKRVRLGVRLDSDGRQIPWESTSLEGDFSFVAGDENQANPQVPTLPHPPGVAQIVKAENAYKDLWNHHPERAEAVFRDLASSPHPEVVLMGREGLAEIMLSRGEVDGAIKAANAIIADAPNRAAAYLIRGRALALSGEAIRAEQEVSKAAGERTGADFSWQKTNAYIAAGNAERSKNPQAAMQSYQKAVRESPDSVDALNNLAVALSETGDAKKALATLTKAQKLAPQDPVISGLQSQIAKTVEQSQSGERQKYVNDMVAQLITRERQSKSGVALADDWTSPVIALTVLPLSDITTKEALRRIGLESVLQQSLTQELQERGITVVERVLLDKLVSELNLGSSSLADTDTQIRLGKLFASRLMISGALDQSRDGLSFAARVIDTETTRLMMARTLSVQSPKGLALLARMVADAIAQTIQEKFPLKGRIAAVDKDTVIINLGTKHGAVVGTRFNVLAAAQAIELNGRTLGYREAPMARIEITKAEELMSYSRVVETSAQLEKNQKVVRRDP